MVGHRAFAAIAAALVLVTTGVPAEASFQRMGIPIGTFRVMGNGSLAIDAFCFDITRKSPNAGVNFANVLTDPSKITVKFGESSMSLTQAIREKKVIVHGTQPTFAEFIAGLNQPRVLNRFTPREQTEFRQMQANYRKLSPTEKAQLEAYFRPRLAEVGDHTKIVFENKTGLPMSVNVSSPAVFGDTAETAPDVSALPTTIHNTRDAQNIVWERRSTVHQQQLQDAGFYTGPIDGDLGPMSKAAIASFQDATGLKVTKEIDAATEDALSKASADYRHLGTLNRNRNGYVAAGMYTMRRGPDRALYLVVGANGERLYKGNSAEAAIQSLTPYAARFGADSAYLVPFVRDGDQRTAMELSIRSAARQRGSGGPELFITDAMQEPLAAGKLMGRSVRDVLDDGGEPNSVRLASGEQGFSKTVDLLYADQSTQKLTIFGKTADIVKAFIKNLKYQVAKFRAATSKNPGAAVLTPLRSTDIVNLAMAQTARDFNLSRAELRSQLSARFNGYQIVTRQESKRRSG
jgi:hypothetical protein